MAGRAEGEDRKFVSLARMDDDALSIDRCVFFSVAARLSLHHSSDPTVRDDELIFIRFGEQIQLSIVINWLSGTVKVKQKSRASSPTSERDMAISYSVFAVFCTAPIGISIHIRLFIVDAMDYCEDNFPRSIAICFQSLDDLMWCENREKLRLVDAGKKEEGRWSKWDTLCAFCTLISFYCGTQHLLALS